MLAVEPEPSPLAPEIPVSVVAKAVPQGDVSSMIYEAEVYTQIPG